MSGEEEYVWQGANREKQPLRTLSPTEGFPPTANGLGVREKLYPGMHKICIRMLDTY